MRQKKNAPLGINMIRRIHELAQKVSGFARNVQQPEQGDGDMRYQKVIDE